MLVSFKDICIFGEIAKSAFFHLRFRNLKENGTVSEEVLP